MKFNINPFNSLTSCHSSLKNYETNQKKSH